jgi:hypothetical protein
MTELQKEFEATGYTSWINADLYPDGKIYTQEYTQWLERQVLALLQPLVSGSAVCVLGDMLCKCKSRTYDNFLKDGCEHYR